MTITAMTLVAAATVNADDVDTPLFAVSGFGTVGLVHSSEDRADFNSSAFKPNGAGYSRNWSPDVDSLIAVQLIADFTPQLSAVAQVISEQNYDNTYRPHVEWAYLRYKFTPDFSVRVGRIVLPSLFLSESRKVAYTYPWVRPPLDVYSLVPNTNNDGVDVSYRQQFGEFANTAQIIFGKKDSKLPKGGGDVKVNHFWGVANTLESGPLSVHMIYQQLEVTIDSIDKITDSLRLFGPQGIALAEKYKAKRSSFCGVGANYDPGNWFVMSEWGQLKGSLIFGTRSAWYGSAGLRLGSFTPYATYAQTRANNTSDPGLDVSTLPAYLAGPATSLNAGLNSILNAKPVRDTITIGLRWDFMESADFKLQFDHSRIDANSTGLLNNFQTGFQLGGTLDVFSAAVDFVF